MTMPDLEFNPPWLGPPKLPDQTPPLRWRATYLGVGILIGIALGLTWGIIIFAVVFSQPDLFRGFVA
jgi:hypothetical protein